MGTDKLIYEYLCAYDYGTGAVWVTLLAPDEAFIRERFPGFTHVFPSGTEPEFIKTELGAIERIDITSEKNIQRSKLCAFLERMKQA